MPATFTTTTFHGHVRSRPRLTEQTAAHPLARAGSRAMATASCLQGSASPSPQPSCSRQGRPPRSAPPSLVGAKAPGAEWLSPRGQLSGKGAEGRGSGGNPGVGAGRPGGGAAAPRSRLRANPATGSQPAPRAGGGSAPPRVKRAPPARQRSEACPPARSPAGRPCAQPVLAQTTGTRPGLGAAPPSESQGPARWRVRVKRFKAKKLKHTHTHRQRLVSRPGF